MSTKATEILIHAYLADRPMTHRYDFILDQQLKLLECIQVSTTQPKTGKVLKQVFQQFQHELFEIGHIRVNPSHDNHAILERLKEAFSTIGVKVSHQPHPNSMAMCYKPLGELSDTVRFHLKNQGIIFLSPSMRPKLIYSK